MHVVWYMVVDHVGETPEYRSHAVLLLGRKKTKNGCGSK